MLSQKQLGRKIKEFRENSRLSQEELAKKTGFSRVAISQIEIGNRGLEALELAKIAKVFYISVDYFLLDEKKSRKSKKVKKLEKFKFNKDKLKSVILYILEKCGGKPNLGETVLYKMLYFIDFDSYEIYGKPITGLNYIKLQFGPVPKVKEYNSLIQEMIDSKELEIITRDYYGMPQKRYIALINYDISLFNAKEIKTIDEVIAKLSDMNAGQIEDYVHKDAPWEIAEEKEIIPYNLVFERVAPYAHFDYEKMWQDTSAYDVLKDLGELSEKEQRYYQNLK